MLKKYTDQNFPGARRMRYKWLSQEDLYPTSPSPRTFDQKNQDLKHHQLALGSSC